MRRWTDTFGRRGKVGSWFRGAWNKNPTGKYKRQPLGFASVFSHRDFISNRVQ
jgi:hypothetical protein